MSAYSIQTGCGPEGLYIKGVPAPQFNPSRISMPATKTAVLVGLGLATFVVCTGTAVLGLPTVTAVCAAAAALFAIKTVFSSNAPGVSKEEISQKLKSHIYATLHTSHGLGPQAASPEVEAAVNLLVNSIESALTPYYTNYMEKSSDHKIRDTTVRVKNAWVLFEGKKFEFPKIKVKIGSNPYYNKLMLNYPELQRV